MHFVSKNPGVEDLEEIIKDDILGDMFEGIKKKAAKNIDKAAAFCGIEPELLQEIIDAKQMMLDKSNGGKSDNTEVKK